MGIIGKTESTGGGLENRTSDIGYSVNRTDSYIPSADEELDQAFIDTEGNTVDTTIDVGVVRVDTGALIASVDLTISASAPRQLASATYPAGTVLSAGVEYAHIIGSGAQTTGFPVYRSGAGEPADGNNDLADTGYPLSGPVTLPGTQNNVVRHSYSTTKAAATVPTTRKGSTLTVDKPGTLGTITTATLNAVNVFDHLTAQDATTATFAGAITDEITTSGEYALVLGDGTVTETVTIQVNVFGVAPSNNPVQKDGAALASLTGVQVRVTNGANINGTELFYSGTATTDASGNLSTIDLSSTAAADTDPVLLHMRTAAGDSIIASETVGLI